MIALADAARETSAAAVSALHDLGVDVVMLSASTTHRPWPKPTWESRSVQGLTWPSKPPMWC